MTGSEGTSLAGDSPRASAVDSVADDPSSKAGQGTKQRKKSQRPSWSCTECTRRKIKCNRIVPGCDQCLKRQKVHLCRLEADESTMLAAGDDAATSSAPGQVRLASSTEYQALTQSLSAIRLKLFHLERVIASFVPQPGCFGEDGGIMYAFSAQGFSTATTAAGANGGGAPIVDPSNPPLPPLVEEPSREPESARVVDDDGEVEAAVTLEFLALGRDRKQDHFSRSSLRRSDRDAQTPEQSENIGDGDGTASAWNMPYRQAGSEGLAGSSASPLDLRSPSSSGLALLPRREHSDAIIRYSLDRVGWQHGAVHSGSFMAECAEFYGWGDERAEVVNPAWLALYYAVLCVGVKHMTPTDGQACGLGQELKSLPKLYFDASVAALHKSNFLAKHSIYAVQTIVILVLTCQDVGPSDLIATLLACAIRIAIHLNIHRFSSDDVWEARRRQSGVDPTGSAGIKQLIDREVRKRLWAALCTEEWVSYPYRHSCSIFPSHFTTPLPNNVLDEDLGRGQMIIRGPSEPTPVSKLITMFQTASCLRRFFEDTDSAQGGASYELCLQVDREIRDIIQRAPTYLQPNADLASLPSFARWMNHYFIMSVSHKLLVIHRVFLGAAFKDPRYSYSRKAAIGAARVIIRELVKGSSLPFQHVWTVPYHAIVGATTLILDVFQCSASDPRDDVANKRYEVEMAIAELRILAPDSPIAARGVQLLSTLLYEEARHRSAATLAINNTSSKRTATAAELERFGDVAKRVVSSSRRGRDSDGSGVEDVARAGLSTPIGPAVTHPHTGESPRPAHSDQHQQYSPGSGQPRQPSFARHLGPPVLPSPAPALTQEAFDAILSQAGLRPHDPEHDLASLGSPGAGLGTDAYANIDFWRMLDATTAMHGTGGLTSENEGLGNNLAAPAGWAAQLPYEFGGHGNPANSSYDGLGWI